MKNVKILLALLLALTVMFSLCACGGDTDAGKESETTTAATEESTQGQTEETTQETVDDGKLTYKVIVVDEAGAPIAGAMVQICEGTACNPGMTNAEGVAEIRAVEGSYEAKMLSMPEGYTYATEEEVFPYASGELEVTIVLKSAA